MLEGHIAKAYDGALSALHMRVLEMGGLALDQVRESVHAYTQWNPVSAQRVVERERMVNDYDSILDTEQLALIARRNPVASDLRIIIAIAKTAAELERIGDEATKIARNVLTADLRPAPPTCRDVAQLARLAMNQLRQGLEAFDRLEATLAAQVIHDDRLVDAEYAAALQRLRLRAVEPPLRIGAALDAAFVLKSLERIGDHARNLARHIQAIGPRDAWLAALSAKA